MLQQDFRDRLAATNLHRASVLLASNRDKALWWSQQAHTVPHTALDAINMDGAGSRAGYCAGSLCCHPEAFTTLDCSAARCSDSDNHEYVCASPAVVACLTRLFDNTAWNTAPQIVILPSSKQINNSGAQQMLQVNTLQEP